MGDKAELIDRVLTHARGKLSARDAVEYGNLLIHGKTTQAQSPVILMTLEMTLRHTSKRHCTGGRNLTSKLGMRESTGGDFF